MENYFDDLLNSYKLLKQRKFRLSINEDAEDKKIKVKQEAEKLKKVVQNIPKNQKVSDPNVPELTPYREEGKSFPIYVQASKGGKPIVLSTKDGNPTDKWDWLAKTKLGHTEDDDGIDDRSKTNPQPPQESNPEEEGNINDLSFGDAKKMQKIQKVASKLEGLNAETFFEQGPEWVNQPNALADYFAGGTPESVIGKLDFIVDYSIEDGIVIDKILAEETKDYFVDALSKAIEIISKCYNTNKYPDLQVQEVGKLLTIDGNGVWVKGVGLPEYGIGLGPINNSLEEALQDPLINMCFSFNKRVKAFRKYRGDKNWIEDTVTIAPERRLTTLQKENASDQIWRQFLGDGYEVYAVAACMLKNGNKQGAMLALKEANQNFNLHIQKFNELLTGSFTNTVLFTEKLADGLELYKYLLTKFGVGSILEIQQPLFSEYARWSTYSLAERIPDAIIPAKFIEGQGLKASVLEVYRIANTGGMSKACNTFGIPAAKVKRYIYGSMTMNNPIVDQTIDQFEEVYIVPVKFTLSWFGKESNFVKLSDYPVKSILSKNSGAFHAQNLALASSKNPFFVKEVDKLFNLFDKVDNLFKEKEILAWKGESSVKDAISMVAKKLADGDYLSRIALDEFLDKDLGEHLINKVKFSIQKNYLLSKFKVQKESNFYKELLSLIILESVCSIDDIGIEIRDLNNGTCLKYNNNEFVINLVKYILDNDVKIQVIRDTDIRLFTIEYDKGALLTLSFKVKSIEGTDSLVVTVILNNIQKNTKQLKESKRELLEKYLAISKDLLSSIVD